MKKQIVEGGGAIISELLPHAGVEARYFHDRNRIISGLGMGTLVIEASTRSGCLLTANHAIEQSRDLFCVPPGDITQEYCAGVVPYLRDGAIPVFDYLDIVHEYMYHYFNRINPDAFSDKFRRQAVSAQKKPAAANTVKPRPAEEKAPAAPIAPAEQKKTISDEVYSQLNEEQAKLLRLAAEKPLTADDLIELTGMQYAKVAEALTELEIAGHIQLLPDGKYGIS